jgi:hypothetical protein
LSLRLPAARCRSSSRLSSATVIVGGVAYPPLVWGHSSVTCTLPDGQGTAFAVIVTPVGTGTSSTTSLTFSYSPPTITSV